MTEELKQELKELEYVSMADFCNKIDQIDDIDDKLEFATQYLLMHKDNVDYSFNEAINVARMKLADAFTFYKEQLAKQEIIDQGREAFSDYSRDSIDLEKYGDFDDNKKLENFMTDPTVYLKIESNKRINELQKIATKTKKDTDRLHSYEHTQTTLINHRINLEMTDRQTSFLHITARLEAKYGSERELNKAYNNTKPGFWSKLFGTTSVEGENLDIAYKGFMNHKSSIYGNMDTLANAAEAYLKHIFPNYEPGYPLPDIHMVNNLKGTQKSRSLLCLPILDSIRKERKSTEDYREMTEKSDEREFEFSNFNDKNNIKREPLNIDDSMENSYSNEYSNDNNVSNDNSIDNSISEENNNNIISNDNYINNEDMKM